MGKNGRLVFRIDHHGADAQMSQVGRRKQAGRIGTHDEHAEFGSLFEVVESHSRLPVGWRGIFPWKVFFLDSDQEANRDTIWTGLEE